MRVSTVTKACWLLLLLLAPIAFMGSVVRAEGEGDDAEATVEDVVVTEEAAGEAAEGEEKEKEIGPNADVDAMILFYSHPEKSFPAGDVVKAAVGFANRGVKDLLVTKIEGSFRYPQDFKYVIQNFTSMDVNEVVRANTEASFAYYFRPDPNFDPRPFGLVITVDYADIEGTFYQSTLFNETVTVTELVEGFDTQTLNLYIILAAGVILVGFLIQRTLGSALGKGSRKSRSSSRVETGTRSANAAGNEWLEGLVDQKPQRAAKSKKIR